MQLFSRDSAPFASFPTEHSPAQFCFCLNMSQPQGSLKTHPVLYFHRACHLLSSVSASRKTQRLKVWGMNLPLDVGTFSQEKSPHLCFTFYFPSSKGKTIHLANGKYFRRKIIFFNLQIKNNIYFQKSFILKKSMVLKKWGKNAHPISPSLVGFIYLLTALAVGSDTFRNLRNFLTDLQLPGRTQYLRSTFSRESFLPL